MINHITSLQNDRVKQWKKWLTPKGRKKDQKYLIEGWHLIEEALKSGEIFECLLTQDMFNQYAHNITVPMTIVTPEIIKALSETESPQQIIGVARLSYAKGELTAGKYMLLDAVQDPGNLGTIIRTADAAGFSGVIIGDGCVDVFNGKTVRSMQGSQFHINIYKMPITKAIDTLRSNGHMIYGTALDAKAQSLFHVKPTEHIAIIVGNEGNGVSKDILQLTDGNLYIPILGEAESLNVSVAAGIAMYHFVKGEKHV